MDAFSVPTNEADGIAGEIYAPPIKLKQRVLVQPRLRASKPVLEEAGRRTSSRSYLRFWSGERIRAGQGPVDLKEVIPPRARRKRKERPREREREIGGGSPSTIR